MPRLKNTTLYKSDCSIYPGEYVPLPEDNEVKKNISHSRKNKITKPLVNIAELSDSYRVEVIIPGVKKENFLISSDKNILSVRIIRKKSGVPETKDFLLHEFNFDDLDRDIVLPKNVDAEFVSAIYNAGILCFYVPKTKHPPRNKRTRIIVY